MANNLKVGDVVEVVETRLTEWMGRQCIVISIGHSYYARKDWNFREDGVCTSPSPGRDEGVCWQPEQLRRINPPDWHADCDSAVDTRIRRAMRDAV